MEICLLLVVFWVIVGGFCAWLASEKGRGGLRWFILGVLLGPIALLALIGAPAKALDPTTSNAPSSVPSIPPKRLSIWRVGEDVLTNCPRCSRETSVRQSGGKVRCRHCGNEWIPHGVTKPVVKPNEKVVQCPNCSPQSSFSSQIDGKKRQCNSCGHEWIP